MFRIFVFWNFVIIGIFANSIPQEKIGNLLYKEGMSKRNMYRRGAACSATTYPTISYPESWQIEPNDIDKTTPVGDNYCAKNKRKKLLLTCGGPKWYQNGSTSLWNCVTG